MLDFNDHSDNEKGRKEGNALFNDALNTFYGVKHMAEDRLDSERGNTPSPFRL